MPIDSIMLFIINVLKTHFFMFTVNLNDNSNTNSFFKLSQYNIYI